MQKVIVVLMLLVVGVFTLQAQDEVPTTLSAAPDAAAYQLVEVASGLRRPIYATNAGDNSGRVFVLEQNGVIRVIQDGQLQDAPFLDLTSIVNQEVMSSYSERGLLGLAFHPDFAENGLFFVHYSDRNGDTVIARYSVMDGDSTIGDPNTAEIIFTHEQPFPNHNGGQIEFGPDGNLYIGLGDGGSQGDPFGNGQNPTTLLAKILRINVDGDAPYAIPDDNPVSGVKPDFAPEVWSIGLRNPYRFSFDRATGDLYIADVGQNQWEEINFQPADSGGGENYGWNIYEADQPYSGEAAPADMVLPVATYDHSQGCSVTGGYVYRGEALPDLQGAYLYGDWCSGKIWAAYRDESNVWQAVEFIDTTFQISGFGEDEQGEIYVIDYSGGIFQLAAA